MPRRIFTRHSRRAGSGLRSAATAAVVAANGTPAFLREGQETMQLPPILLVEDDKNDLLLMRHAFRDAEVKNALLVAENGEVAIELLTKDQNSGTPGVRIVITDINMPIVDGFELLQWLQNQPRLKDITK